MARALHGWNSLATIPTLPKSPKRRQRSEPSIPVKYSLPYPSPEKTSYAVGKGDSLVKIASKFKSNAELIFRANNLQTINLKIGQQLVIPQLDMSMVVDRKARTVTLLNGGQFFKEYRTVALKTPGRSDFRPDQGTDKIALRDSNRVAFGDKNYSGSERWIMLGSVRPRHQGPS